MISAVNTLFERGVMSPSGHGDASSRLTSDRMLLSIPGVIRELQPSDLAVIDLDGSVAEGEIDSLKAEIASLHAWIYRRRDDVNAILHTHSANLLAFAMANKNLPCRYEAMRFGQPAAVPVVPWARRGTAAWASGILEVLEDHPGTRSLLLGNHGVLIFGPDVAGAASLAIVLEEAAGGEIAAERLGGAVDLPLTLSSPPNGTPNPGGPHADRLHQPD